MPKTMENQLRMPIDKTDWLIVARSWPDEQRKQIVADYESGATVEEIRAKYHRDRRAVSALLHFVGVFRDQSAARKMVAARKRALRLDRSESLNQKKGKIRIKSEAIHELAFYLCYAERLIGRTLTEDEIGRVMAYIRSTNKGCVYNQQGEWEEEKQLGVPI